MVEEIFELAILENLDVSTLDPHRIINNYLKLGHGIMQFKEFDWLSGHGI